MRNNLNRNLREFLRERVTNKARTQYNRRTETQPSAHLRRVKKKRESYVSHTSRGDGIPKTPNK